jgi:hypothetical protein
VAVDIPNTKDASSLFEQLKRIDISVPSRIDGRTTHHTETWTICHLLSTLAYSGSLQFPVSLQHIDRPDFCLTEITGETGIEVTEAIPQKYAAYSALAEREFPDVFLEPAHFRWDIPELSLEEMRALLRQKQLSGMPWEGDSPEREWAIFIQSVVDAKLKKMAKADFTIYSRNSLAIYDNLPLPNVNLGKAIAFLRPMLTDRWLQTPSFDSVYIEHGPLIAELSAHHTRNLDIYDLWP